MTSAWRRLAIVAAALGGCVCGRDPGAATTVESSRPPTSESARPPALEASIAARLDADRVDLRLVGTIVNIYTRKPFDPAYRWVVVARVEKVVEGAYDGGTFAFVVHSPFQEGLQEGRRYEIAAAKTSATAYRFVGATEAP